MANICFLFETYYTGGLDTYIFELINKWPNEEDHITLYYNGNYDGIDYINTHVARGKFTCLPYNLATAVHIRNRLKAKFGEGKLYWLLSFFVVYGLLLYYILFAYRKLKLSRFDKLMVINGGYPGGNACRGIAISWHLFSGKKCIHNFHNYAVLSSKYQMILENIIDKWLLKSTDRFVSVSNSCVTSLKIRPSFKHITNLKRIYNGINEKESAQPFDIRSKYNLPTDAVVGLILATYEERKGHDFLYQVTKRVLEKGATNFYLVCCGYGDQDDMNRINHLVEQYNIKEHVVLESFKQNSNDYILSSDLLLIASQDFESFGLTAIEGMKYHRPVISTNVGGLKEVICNTQGGYTFEKDDVEGYANQLIELINNKELRQQQGDLGYQRFIRNFTSTRMCQQYCDLLHGKL